MPVIRIHPLVPQAPAELVSALIEELRRNAPDGPEDAPRIIEEEAVRGNYFAVKVVWDAWKNLGPELRSRTILDAYNQVRPDDVSQISVAIGFTRADAERLHIVF
jgi:hypothetical protein